MSFKILFLTPRYWPARDGTAALMQALAERFARDGGEVDVITADPLEIEGFVNPEKKRHPIKQEIHCQVNIKRIPARHWPGHARVMNWLARLPGKKNQIYFGQPYAYLPDLAKEVNHLSKKYSFVVAGVLPYRMFFDAAIKLKEKMNSVLVGLPLIHLGEPARPGLKDMYLNGINFSLLRRFDVLLLDTRSEAGPLLEAGIDEEKLVTSGVGIDPEKLAGGHSRRLREKFGLRGPIVFSIGTQTHDKGSHQLVEAVKLLWRKIPEVNLVLAGEVLSDFSAYLSRQQLGASGRFFNLGQIGEDDKTDLLASGDLMVLPSRADSFGITYLEAWFYGKPVIGCFAGGVPEVIDDGVDGFLVPFGEAHLLAEYLEKLLLDGALAEKMGQRGRQKVLEKFTWDQVYQRVKTAVEKKFFAG